MYAVKWRNMSPLKMIMSFDLPDFRGSTIMIFYQANSQIPAFARYVLQCSEHARPHRVLDNPMCHDAPCAPQTAFERNVCLRNDKYQIDVADKHGECALCPVPGLVSSYHAVGVQIGCT